MASVETTVTEKQDSPDLAVEALDLVAKGKRNMVCGEVPQAVNQLQEACRLLAEKYGETADECGEAYFLYGKALLDMARVESGVLGNALQGVPEDEEEEVGSTENKDEDKIEKEAAAEGEDMDKIREQVFDAMGERDEEVAARKKEEPKEKDVDMAEDKEKSKNDEKEDSKSEEDQKNLNDEKKGTDEVDKNKDEKKSDQKESDKMETEVEIAKEVKEDEKKEETAKVEKKSDEKKEKEEVATKVPEETKEGTDEKKEAEEMETEANQGEEKTEEGDEEDGDGEEEDEEEGEGSKDKSQDDDADDVPNLQLSWEMLELAKIIFTRQENKEMKLKAAETHLKLGEVGLETEQYEQAIGDFTQCLKIQKEQLDSDDRLLAETYYQLGLAFSFNAQFDESIENFRHATKGIEAKIAKLNKFLKENETGKGKEQAKTDDPIANAHQEIKDLKEILPDIMAKIEDAEEEKKNQDKVKQMVKDNVAPEAESTTTTGFGETSSSSGFGTTSSTSDQAEKKGATNIMHLVRKKRKPEDEQEEPADSKKPRQEDGASGDSTKATETVANGKTGSVANGKEAVNGSGDKVTNGAVNGDHKSPGKTEKQSKEIVTKTVEDVKKAKEGEVEKMETEAAS